MAAGGACLTSDSRLPEFHNMTKIFILAFCGSPLWLWVMEGNNVNTEQRMPLRGEAIVGF